jgi:hypothetical protein
MTIRRNVGALPRSYWFEGPIGAKILDLQGDFFIPFRGAKSRALFKNAVSNTPGADDVELCMQGSYQNRRAEITDKASGNTLETVRCNVWNRRVLAGGRRPYVVSVAPRVDLALIAGMIANLDAQAD